MSSTAEHRTNTAVANRFAAAQALAQFIDGAREHASLWNLIAARAAETTFPPQLVSAANAIGETRHVLVLLEDWCGDAMNTIPFVDAFVSRSNNLRLRVLSRDANDDLMRPPPSTASPGAIPVAIVYDANFNEIGRWGSRPRALQGWIDGEEAARLGNPGRNAHARQWYKDDRGFSAVHELLEILRRPNAA